MLSSYYSFFANTTWLKLTLVTISAVAPLVTTPIAAAATPGAVSQKVPDGNQDDSSEQAFNNRNTFNDRIAGNNHLDDVSEQPDAREGRNNSADKAKGQSPANKKLRNEADDSSNNQIHNITGSDDDSGKQRMAEQYTQSKHIMRPPFTMQVLHQEESTD